MLPGVSVMLKNIDTGSSASTTSNSQGSYNFLLLAPGNYSVSAHAAGFQGVAKNVTVALGSSVTANLELSISSPRITFIPAALLIGFWFLTQLVHAGVVAQVQTGGVAYLAHVGGFVFGAVSARLFEGSSRIVDGRA